MVVVPADAPPIVPVDVLIVPTAVFDDTHVPPAVPVDECAINAVIHTEVRPLIEPGVGRPTVTVAVATPQVWL